MNIKKFAILAIALSMLASCGGEVSSSSSLESSSSSSISSSASSSISSISSSSSHVHDYAEEVVEPTCTEGGYTIYVCQCGDSYQGNETAPLGHDYVDYGEKGKTCTEYGHTAYKECSRCGEREGYELIPPSHNPGEWSVITPASCTQSGEEVRYCLDCGASVNRRVIPALGHTYEGDICSVCGVRRPTEGLAIGLYEWTSTGEGFALVTGIGTAEESDLVLPADYNGYPVLGVLKEAFKGNTSITSVYFPDFGHDYGLDASSFEGCSNLVSVHFAGGTNLYGSVFKDCNKLIKISVPKIEVWLDMAFGDGETYYSDLNPLSSGTIGLYIDDAPVVDLAIPEGVRFITHFAFYNYAYLESVSFPKSLEYIGMGAFRYCRNLSSLSFPEDSLFEEMDTYAFQHCTSLTSVILPDSTKAIGNRAFYACSSLSSVTIGSSCTSIRQFAFGYCSSLTSITIPASVDGIEDSAFKGSGLVSVTFENPFGWVAGITSLSSEDLSDPSLAATYLKDTYKDSKWVRTE